MSPWESGIQSRILKALYKAGMKAINVHGSPFTEAGSPDIIGCVNGRCWVLEVKTPTGELSAIQKVRLGEWHRAGAICCVVTSVSESLACLLMKRGNWEPSN
jgi:hypothetical protein